VDDYLTDDKNSTNKISDFNSNNNPVLINNYNNKSLLSSDDEIIETKRSYTSSVNLNNEKNIEISTDSILNEQENNDNNIIKSYEFLEEEIDIFYNSKQ